MSINLLGASRAWQRPPEYLIDVPSGVVTSADNEEPTPPTSGSGYSGPRWPWEANHESADEPPRPKVEAGPTVHTGKLYRSAEDPIDAPTAAIPSVGAQSDDSDIDPAKQPEMLSDMSSATGVIPPTVEGASEPLPSGWRTSAVFLFIFLPTVAVGFLDMTLHREFTYWTGAVFVLTCLVAALKVRPSDLWTAVIVPPIAYLLALVIAGQPSTFPGSGSVLLREVSLIATGLAFNAPYIYGGTLVAFIVVLIRRPRARKALQSNFPDA